MPSNSGLIRDLSPPGELLEEALHERGMTNAELARRTGLSEKHVSQLINAHVPLSMDVALQLERVLQIPARFWSALEFNYRAEQRRREQRKGLRAFAGWMRRFPVSAMRRTGYFSAAEVGQSVEDRVEALLDFFGVTSPGAWEAEWRHATARFRKSTSFQPDHYALTAWLRRGEIESQEIRCEPYDPKCFYEALEVARSLTTVGPEQFIPELTRVCAGAGIALTFVPALPHLAISGATRWKGNDKALLSLSLRHKSDDQLWFSFFHEACHVLEHRVGSIYIDAASDSDNDPMEHQANKFARDMLISPERYTSFRRIETPRLADVKAFSQSIGVSPGIVVGRLQFDGVFDHRTGNGLKRFFRWDFESK